ncbi:hypothetical protein, conserved [Babesia ovata]|uniref:Uncharacterized protein n=1 Tax=Babesia ovata TaxID=189622 RepID=A0A2H6K8K9_9APIC|nr:uncharacterized protein BOVATA_008350 [Babesia ovata]GBE59342.1 hypothetical protein, conserved [Babesia ovata]
MVRQPKKLTDCPENLRESIDWLIQVRHGNGGLEELSKALKLLIEQAIERAKESLEKRRNELECPFQHKGYKSYCEYVDKTIEQLESEKSSQSKDDTERNRLENQIARFQGKKESCKSSHKIDPKRTAEIEKEISQDYEVVNKLQGFLEELNKVSKSTDNNILTQLCSGLETFLGFSPASKGYSGEGIVYSDLDRLCDGVMSFLHGVLNEVHTNKNLEPYKKALNETVTLLETHRNDGKTGLRDVIDRVKQGIGDWLGDVKLKSDNVKNPIGELLSDSKINNIPKLIEDIRDMGKKNYDEVYVSENTGELHDWVQSVSRLMAKTQDSLDALSHIDNNLKTNLEPHVNLVHNAVETFMRNDVGDFHNLIELFEQVENQFNGLNKVVAGGLDEQSGLRYQFKEGIDGIQKTIRDERVGELFQSIKKAKGTLMEAKVVADAYIGNFTAYRKAHITDKFDALMQKADVLKANAQGASLHDQKCQLEKELESVTNAVEEIEAAYTKRLLKVKADVIKDVNEALNETHHGLDALDGHIKTGLLDIRNKIKSRLVSFGKSVQRKILDAAADAKRYNSDNNALAVISLGNQLSTAGLNELGEWLKAIPGSKKEFAEPLQDMLYHLDQAKSTDKNPGHFADLLSTLHNALSSAIDAELENVIKQRKSEIEFGDNTIMKEYYSETKNGDVPGTLRGFILKIKNKVKNDGFDEDESGAAKFYPVKMNGYTHEDAKVATDNQGSRTKYDKALAKVKSTIDKLEDLPKAINTAKEEAEKLAAVYEDRIKKLVKTIGDTIAIVTSAEEQLTALLDKLRGALNAFEKTFLAAIQGFDDYYKTQSSAAKMQIKNEAFQKFALTKSRQLEGLKDLVSKEFDNVKRAIMRDRLTGIKGLMKWMYGKDGKHITSISTAGSSTTEHGDKVADISLKFKNYSTQIFDYLTKYPPQNFASQPSVIGDYSKNVSELQSKVEALLSHLSEQKHFTHQVPGMLQKLKTSVQALHSTAFANLAYPVLDAFPKSLERFVEQLERGYVNRYEGGEEILLYNYLSNKITPEGEKCAKIFLTLLETVNYDLRDLLSGHDSHEALQIYLKGENRLGRWFKGRGFKVSDDDKTQNGELDRKKTGGNIREFLVKDDGKHVYRKDTGKTDTGPLRRLVGPLRDYYRVCHYEIPPKPRAPSSVKDMLQWLLGLYFNPIYNQLGEYFKELFEKPKHHEDKKYSEIDESQLSLVATTTIRPKELKDILRDVCLHSENTLIAILGRGHENGRYAVDFYTNADKLDYPSSPSVCFDLLVDILFRVYHQLHFVFSQCQNGTSRGGWSDCYYGRGVGGSDWNCNTMQCPNQSGDQKHKQKCDQNCNQNAKCGLKSPLQSFLEDGLPGFLPHSFKSPGCKLECTLANHRGIPCLTPMGFSDISATASQTNKGEHLWKVLYKFCGPDSYLRKLCCQLNCLLRRPPQTLGDMLAFYHSYLSTWSGGSKDHKSVAFNQAVSDANFGDDATKLEVVSIQGSKSHTAKHSQGDLFSIILCDPKTNSGLPCGSYLQSISEYIRLIYSKEHASNYLSWVVYITETFYDLLKKLYDDCCEKCNKPSPKCNGSRCANHCQVKSYYDSQTTDGEKAKSSSASGQVKHSKLCNSILNCKNTHSIIYTAGFTFGSPDKLSGETDRATKRTCDDFCKTLGFVVKDGSVLYDLVHKHIPGFLWDIRFKFFYTLLALWSLSLLYLLHITVVRLDVLRIRSHLRSPSSHRIAAQSLLAAARVGKLSKISYLQA